MYRHPWLLIDKGADVGRIKSVRGRTSFITWGCHIANGVTIGQGVMIGPNTTIVTSSHPFVKGKWIKDQKTLHKKVVIGNDVLIGAGAVILSGNTIKDHAVIGAGAVLTEDHTVGENEVWVGNPAMFIKYRYEEKKK